MKCNITCQTKDWIHGWRLDLHSILLFTSGHKRHKTFVCGHGRLWCCIDRREIYLHKHLASHQESSYDAPYMAVAMMWRERQWETMIVVNNNDDVHWNRNVNGNILFFDTYFIVRMRNESKCAFGTYETETQKKGHKRDNMKRQQLLRQFVTNFTFPHRLLGKIKREYLWD